MKHSAQVVVATLIAVLIPGLLFGQVKPDEPVKSVRIYGRVSDVTGASVGDATVVLKRAGSTEASASTKTSETGEYTFLVVPHRSFELHFASPGFRTETKMVTADNDTDVGSVMLSVAQGGGPSSVIDEPSGRTARSCYTRPAEKPKPKASASNIVGGNFRSATNLR